MLETLIAAGIVGMLALVMLLPKFISGWVLLKASLVMVVVGLAVGIPAGIQYHLVLVKHWPGARPKRWWIDPSSLHVRLLDSGRRAIKPWWVLGGLGWWVAMAGCLVAFVGALALE